MARSGWSIAFHPACEARVNDLEQADQEALLAAIRVLRVEGPNLGRPLVDTVKGSRHPNMKELRPGSTGRTEIRVLFAFDKVRMAILLVGGDKSDNWRGWYREEIPIADERFDEHQRQVDGRTAKEAADNWKTPKRKRRR